MPTPWIRRGSNCAKVLPTNESPYEAANGASCIALLVDTPEFLRYDWEELGQVVVSDALLLDCWRSLSDLDMKNFHYLPLGVGIR